MADTGGCIIANDAILTPDDMDAVIQAGYVVSGSIVSEVWYPSEPMIPNNENDILQAGFGTDVTLDLFPETPITGEDKVGA